MVSGCGMFPFSLPAVEGVKSVSFQNGEQVKEIVKVRRYESEVEVSGCGV